MSFVIFSSGSLTDSRVRTFSSRRLKFALLGLVVFSLVSGFTAGYVLRDEPEPEIVVVEEVVTPTLPDLSELQVEGEAGPLIDRIAELSARMIRLESEAILLGRRIGAIHEFENSLPGTAEAPAPAGAADEESADELGDELADEEAGLLPSLAGEGFAAMGGPLIAPNGESLHERLSSDDMGLDMLERDLARIGAALAALDDVTTERNLAFMAFPARIPVHGADISSGFGNRLDPFTRGRAFHKGVDYAAPPGTPIRASGGGKVVTAKMHRAYGRMVEIDHGNGLKTRYAHALRLLVQEGDLVMPGQKIATVGSSGRSTGPHLHFEVIRNGKVVDPRHYLVSSLGE